jgi:hypothetical protein
MARAARGARGLQSALSSAAVDDVRSIRLTCFSVVWGEMRRPRGRDDGSTRRFRAAAVALEAAALIAATATVSLAIELEVDASFTGSNSLQDVLAANPRPDPGGAVGPAHFVELLSARYAVYDKATGTLLDSSSHVQFWSDSGAPEPIDFAFDPRIVYDAPSGRWFAAAITFELVGTDSWIAFAVSNGSDPADGWTGFHIDADPTAANWLDTMALGVDADAVYLATIRQQPVTEVGLGLGIVVLPKAALLEQTPDIAGATLFSAGFLAPGAGVQLSVNLDGSGPPMPLLSNVSNEVREVDIQGPVDVPELEPRPAIDVDALPRATGAAQPGPKPDLVLLGGFKFGANAMLRGGSLWAAQGVEIEGRAAIRWLELDPGSSALLDSGVIADPELDLYLPSIAVNEQDHVVIGFQGSSEAVYPSAYAIAGERVGGAMSFGEPLLLRAGTADYEVLDRLGRNGWGDHSSTVVDPSDASSFWTFQQFASDEDVWGISITKLSVPEPSQVLCVAAGALVLLARRWSMRSPGR